MPVSTRVEELLSLWQNGEMTPEELCPDDPALCQRLKEVIQDLQFMEVFLHMDEPTVSKKLPSESPSEKPTSPKEPAKSVQRASLIACQWLDKIASGEKKTPQELFPDDANLLKLVKQVIFQASRFERGSSKTPVDGTNEAPQKKTGENVDKYVLKEFLGQGGFGEVWKAWDSELERDVALKRPRPDLPISPQQIASFLSEAQKLAKLQHPNIIPLYHFGKTDDSCYLVSPFVPAQNLSQYRRSNSLSATESAKLIAAIADALHYAHVHDIIHRDVKPANILIDSSGKPYLTDFGLAISEAQMLREKKSRLGTYSYMSPEQARGTSNMTDARTDIYSLGVVFYYLLTDRLPFSRETSEDFVQDILERPPRPPRTIKDNIPAELERICLKCLEKKLNDRYTNAKDLSEELRRWLATGDDSQAHEAIAAPSSPVAATVASTPKYYVLGLCVVASATLLIYLSIWFSDFDPPGTTPTSKNNQTKAIDKATPDLQHVLRHKPKLLTQNIGAGKVIDMDFDADKEELKVMADCGALIQFAELSQNNFEFECELKPIGLGNRIAFFFGLRPAEKYPKAFAVYQFFDFELDIENNQRVCYCYRKTATDRWFQLGYPMPNQKGRSKVASLDATYHPFKLTVRDGQLKSVSWDNKELSELSGPDCNAHFKPEDFHGGFGIIVRDSSLFIRKVRVQIPETEK